MKETDLMVIWLNGDRRDTAAQNVCDLVESLDLPVASLLVEHNGLALRRDEWPGSRLAGGDRIEIVRIVAGG